MIAGSDAAGAWHELEDDVGIAGNVTAQMISDSAAIELVGAARPGPHQDRNGFALVEVGDGLGRCGTGRKRCDCKDDRSGDGRTRWMQHGLSSGVAKGEAGSIQLDPTYNQQKHVVEQTATVLGRWKGLLL